MKKSKVLLSIILALSLLAVSILPVFAESVTVFDNSSVEGESKIDKGLLKKINEGDKDERFSVIVWYKDINQSKVTEKAIQETASIISKRFELPDNDSSLNYLNSIALSEKVNSLSDDTYNTNEIYIETRRKIASQHYQDLSKSLISKSKISYKNIVFCSRYAPMLIANLTVGEVKNLASVFETDSISEYEEIAYEPATIATASANVSIDDIGIDSDLGLTGNNVKIGMVDIEIYGSLDNGIDLDNDEYVIRYDNGIEMHDYGQVVKVGPTSFHNNNHGIGTANILLTIAPNITLYSTQWDWNYIEVMLDEGVNLINFCMSQNISEYSPSYAYTDSEKWIDHVATYHNVMVVVAAGNKGKLPDGNLGPRVTSPGLANNAITVGSVAEVNSYNNVPNGEDTLLASSSYKNKANGKYGVEKPDVVMPTTQKYGGTSYATPVLTGMLALMLQLSPKLKTNPLALKAIVLASCHRKVKQYTTGVPDDFLSGVQERIEDGITERQGAGVPDAVKIVNIITQGTYGVGTITDLVHSINFEQPSYDAENMNVSLAWFRDNTINNNHTEIINTGTAHNLNLTIMQNDSSIRESNLTHSSSEMCYFPISNTNIKYRIVITNQDANLSNVPFAYAWSTDSTWNTTTKQYGSYYIRNANSNEYLTYNSAASSANLMLELNTINSQNNLNQTHKWALSDGFNTAIQPVFDFNAKNIGSGAVYIDNISRYARIQSGEKLLYFIDHKDGTHSIINILNGDTYALSYDDNRVIWKHINTTADISISEKWYFDKSNYLIGDVNLDGCINYADTVRLSSYLGGLVAFNNLQKYLSDVNQDGNIDYYDELYLTSII